MNTLTQENHSCGCPSGSAKRVSAKTPASGGNASGRDSFDSSKRSDTPRSRVRWRATKAAHRILRHRITICGRNAVDSQTKSCSFRPSSKQPAPTPPGRRTPRASPLTPCVARSPSLPPNAIPIGGRTPRWLKPSPRRFSISGPGCRRAAYECRAGNGARSPACRPYLCGPWQATVPDLQQTIILSSSCSVVCNLV